MKFNKELSMLATVGVFFVWAIFFMFTLGVQFCGEGEKFSRMGDAFNMLNALFAGLAFTAICFQLWMQQTQINDEQQARYRADRISALATLIQLTYDKLIYERDLLLKIAPSFKYISFLEEKDAVKLQKAIKVREELVQAQREQQTVCRASGLPQPEGAVKDISDNEIAIPLMKQVAKLVEQLTSYETEMDRLLSHPATDKSNSPQK